MYYCDKGGHELYFQSGSSKPAATIWDIREAKQLLGDEICEQLPFVHAIFGCDMTLHLFGIGKGVALKKAMNNKFFWQQASVFSSPLSTHDDVAEAGEHALVCLYGGDMKELINDLKYRRFCAKAAIN